MKKIIATNVLVLLLFFLVGCQSNEEKKYNSLISKGKDALSDERYEDAIDTFTKAFGIHTVDKETIDLLLEAKEQAVKEKLRYEIEEEVVNDSSEEDNEEEISLDNSSIAENSLGQAKEPYTRKYFFDYTVDEFIQLLNTKYGLSIKKQDFEVQNENGNNVYIITNPDGISLSIMRSLQSDKMIKVSVSRPASINEEEALLKYTVLSGAIVELADQGFTYESLLRELKKEIIDYGSYAEGALWVEGITYTLSLGQTDLTFALEEIEP